MCFRDVEDLAFGVGFFHFWVSLGAKICVNLGFKMGLKLTFLALEARFVRIAS